MISFVFAIISAVVLVTFCNYYVDIGSALFVKEFFRGSTSWTKYSANVPDALFYVVCVTTLVSFGCYLIRVKKTLFSRATWFFLLVTYAVPLSYVLKDVLKPIFGRVNTRVWLLNPELYGFHWFHGTRFFAGFPSGHMAVFTTLLAALWRFYPRYRPLYLGFSLLLAMALVTTNYHFVGDVIGGTYLGIFVEAGIYRLLNRSR